MVVTVDQAGHYKMTTGVDRSCNFWILGSNQCIVTACKDAACAYRDSLILKEK